MSRRVPCVLMRGGTSRGPFLLASDLPADAARRDAYGSHCAPVKPPSLLTIMRGVPGNAPILSVTVTWFVNSAPSFTDQPKVANGASELMQAVFGDAGKHARSAVGVPVLPLGAAVEVDAIVEIA